MKILIATRLFSALEYSVTSRSWQPKGIPAIYKLIEGLDNDPDIQLRVVLADKNGTSEKEIPSGEITLPPLKAKFIIMPFFSGVISPLRFLHRIQPRMAYLNEIHHTVKIILMSVFGGCDVIVVDRMHVGVGFICSYVFGKSVVLRLLGIYKEMFDSADASNFPATFFSKIFYSARFKYVICTQDGSGGEQFISKMIRKGVPSVILFNGVDDIPRNSELVAEIRQKHCIEKNVPVLLFVGKLQDYKGCLEFVMSLISLSKTCSNFHGIVVGDGPLRMVLEEKVIESGLEKKIAIVGSVRHEIVAAYLEISDIYISLNREGNLSNTVLEAMKSGKCIVRLASSKKEYKDLFTDEILDEKTAPRVPRDSILDELPKILLDLIQNPEIIKDNAKRTRETAEKYLCCWNSRISREISIIKECADPK
jgi:glycosyltransferase involved in cell wall biosynthesis